MVTSEKLSAALAPLQHVFSFPQFEALLYAYLPSKIDQRFPKTGIYAVDTFVCTATVTAVLTAVKVSIILAAVLYARARSRVHPELPSNDTIAILVEPIANSDDYHHSKSLSDQRIAAERGLLGLANAHPELATPLAPNVYHQALLYLVSESVKNNGSGNYTLKPNFEVDHGALEPPHFNTMPQPGQVHSVRYGDIIFHISFESNTQQQPQRQSSAHIGAVGNEIRSLSVASNEPSIRVSTSGSATVATVTSFLKDITRDYLEYADSVRKKTRARYDYAASCKWVRICTLYENQGLQTVALCPRNEELIEQDLKAFVNNKAFYKRIGAPHVHGYLLYGKPGTGKTSLIFAIASVLRRHLYFINLAYIDSDSELFQAFANVPSNSIVVFEDIDTMTPVLHRRKNGSSRILQDSDSQNEKFNLSTFLSILDGHTLEEGIIFIMTTNHPELLDPAVIRPGRMDVRLELTYATHYQMRRMYRMVVDEDDKTELDDIFPTLQDEIPEFVIPPSEVMQIMVQYRSHSKKIAEKLRSLAIQYQNANKGNQNVDRVRLLQNSHLCATETSKDGFITALEQLIPIP